MQRKYHFGAFIISLLLVNVVHARSPKTMQGHSEYSQDHSLEKPDKIPELKKQYTSPQASVTAVNAPVADSACTAAQSRSHLFHQLNEVKQTSGKSLFLIEKGDCRVHGIIEKTREGYVMTKNPRTPTARKLAFRTLDELVALFQESEKVPGPKPIAQQQQLQTGVQGLAVESTKAPETPKKPEDSGTEVSQGGAAFSPFLGRRVRSTGIK